MANMAKILERRKSVKVLKFLDENFEKLIISFTIVLMAIVMMVQIIMRSIGFSITWAEEFCRYLFICGCSLGVSYSTKKENHLRLDIIPTFVPVLRVPFEIFADITMLIAMILMCKAGLPIVVKIKAMAQVSPSLRLPMWIIYIPYLVGCIGTVIRLIQKWVLRIMHKDISGKKAKANETVDIEEVII